MIDSVPAHYASSGIVERILAASPPGMGDPPRWPPEAFFPFDQLHGREVLATRDHAARLAPQATDRILDVGAGIGGPARYLAATYGCVVEGVDLTPSFVEAARHLTALCNLDHRVTITQADATTLPFADASFDHAVCFYVGMNLTDKPAVARAIAAALKPGGRLIWTEAVTTGAGAPHYPLPWAREPAASQLSDAVGLQRALRAAGFDVVAVVDETDLHLDLARQRQQAGQPIPEPQRQANAVVLGADFIERRANYIRSLADGCLASLMLDLVKR